MSKMRLVVFYGFLILFVGAITAVFAELLSQFVYIDNQFGIHNARGVFQHDPILGWKGTPNYQGIPRRKFGARVSINSDGFRDSDWAGKLLLAQRTGRPRILFLGDSFMFGARIDAQDRFSEQLATIQREHGNDIVFFNAGIPGFGTGQEYRAFETLSPRIKPDIVVLNFVRNDIGDASLPYNSHHSMRVYKPYYDLAGNLVLNKTVPQRFSYAIGNTFLSRFRSKFLVDALQRLYYEHVTYSRFDLPVNISVDARAPVRKHWFQYDSHFGHDSIFNLYQFRDLYDRESKRNIALMRKMQEACEQNGSRFIVVVDFAVGDDAGYSERDFMSRLAENRIATVNIHEALQRYWPWSYVEFDGHPNFLNNYIRAIALYNHLHHTALSFDPRQADWYAEIPEVIDFSKGKYDRFLFGEWYRRKDRDPPGERWMGDSASVIMRPPEGSDRVRITIEGESQFIGENTSLYMLGGTEHNVISLVNGGKVVGQQAVPNRGRFRLQFKDQPRSGLMLLQVVSSRSFRPYISGVSDDERQLSVLISRIEVTGLQ